MKLVTACLWLFCTALLLLPKPWVLFWNRNIPEEFGFGFGVEHLYMFGMLGFFTELSRRQWHSLTWLHILVAYGLATEILQHFIPNRTCDLMDFCQDCTGAYLGIFLGLSVKHLYGRFRSHSS